MQIETDLTSIFVYDLQELPGRVGKYLHVGGKEGVESQPHFKLEVSRWRRKGG